MVHNNIEINHGEFAAAASALIFGNADQQDWQGAIHGNLPDWANGSLYLNGPAAFNRNGLFREHWIDGDGMVRRFHFSDGQACYRSRYVQTRRFVDEQAQSRAIYRSFATAFHGDELRQGTTLNTPANVSVHPFADHLLAFGEQCLPWALNPETLTTLQEHDFNGALPGTTALSAHPKIDRQRRQMCNFGVTYRGLRTQLDYFEWDENLSIQLKGTVELSEPYLIHDFLISENFACFQLSPFYLDILAFAGKGLSLLDATRWKPNHETTLLLISRTNGKELARTNIDTRGFSLHTLNAYESGGLLITDVLESDSVYYNQYYAEPGLFDSIGNTRVRRSIFRCTDGQLLDSQITELGLHCDFPCLPASDIGKPSQFIWMLGMPTEPVGIPKFYERIVRFDTICQKMIDCHICQPGLFLAAEPQFIASPGPEQEGILVCQSFNINTKCSSYIFLDAFNLNRGVIARTTLPFFDPPAFHTAFA